MTIYDEINELLEDKSIDSAQVDRITWGPGTGFGVVLDDGSRRVVSERDYRLLEDNLEAMNAAWRAMQKSSKR